MLRLIISWITSFGWFIMISQAVTVEREAREGVLDSWDSWLLAKQTLIDQSALDVVRRGEERDS